MKIKMHFLKLLRLTFEKTGLKYYSLYYYKLKFLWKPPRSLKLHLGCGHIRKNGYINIDHRHTKATNMVCDIKRLPFPQGSVKCIETYHVIEHIPHPQVLNMLKEWYRVLEEGGLLIIECPNFDEAIHEYLEGNKDRIYNIFGLQRFPGDAHLFGYNPEQLTELLKEVGFEDIRMAEPIDYHKNDEPCMRIEGTKL